MTIAPPPSRIRLLVKTALLHTCLASSIALAQVFSGLPTMPGATLLGLTGNNTTGYGDVMLPLFGQSTSFFHINPQGLLNHTGDYTASLGGGFRHLTESAGIIGAYVFGDYNRASSGNKYWFVSPGIERLGEVVDFGANVYIPTGEQRRETGIFTGEELGRTDHVFFERHSHFDSIFRTFESVGTGVDAEVGVRIPMMNTNPKVYVGGYYFNPKDNSGNNNRPQGLTARLEIPLTDQLMLVASDGYDNIERNTFKIGASYNFGGRKTGKNFKGDLTQRLVDPIRRNVIAISGPSNTAQPVVQDSQLVRENVLIRDHIAFFDENANTGGNGTYERPFNVFTQGNVDTANTGGNYNFYVNSGTYALAANTITLTDNNLYGRQDDEQGQAFVESAVGNNRPQFTSSVIGVARAFELVGNNLFDSVRVTGTNNQDGIGIFMDNLVNENMIFLMNNTEVSNFAIGMLANNHGNELNVTINNSTFRDNDDGFIPTNLSSGTFNLITNFARFTNNRNGLNPASDGVLGTFNWLSNYSEFNNNDIGVQAVVIPGATFNMTANHSRFNQNNNAGLVVINLGVTNLLLNHSTLDNNAGGTGQEGALFVNLGIFNFAAYRSSFSNNGTYGILIQNQGFDAVMNATVIDSIFADNGASGIDATNFGSVTMNIQAINSIFSGNDIGIRAENATLSDGVLNVTVTGSVFAGNNIGIDVENNGTGTADLTVDSSIFVGNGIGIQAVNTDLDVINSIFIANGVDIIDVLADNVPWNVESVTHRFTHYLTGNNSRLKNHDV